VRGTANEVLLLLSIRYIAIELANRLTGGENLVSCLVANFGADFSIFFKMFSTAAKIVSTTSKCAR
jgi:hypothetical protein